MTDKGEFRGIYVALMDSWEFQELSACARACFFALKLKLGKAGIDVFYPEVLPRYTGHSAADCDAAMRELEDAEWIRTERNVVWIRNGMKHDPSDPIASPNGRTSIRRHLGSLPSLPIVADFAQYYGLADESSPEDPKGVPEPLPNPLTEGPVKPLGRGMPTTEDGRRKTDTDTNTSSILKLHARDEIEDQANEIIRLANRGMADNAAIGDACNPIPTGHASRQTVTDWLRDGIPAATAGRAVYRRALEYQPDGRRRQITTMKYFDGAVRDEHDRQRARGTPAPPKSDERTGSNHRRRVAAAGGGAPAAGSDGRAWQIE